jgi:hypothetical protein
MLLQPDTWSCGVYAIVNACLALGHDHTSEIARIKQLAGTTKENGTDEKGIACALRVLQYSVQELRGQPLDALLTSIRASLDRGSPTILCVDGVDHWVVVIGSIHDRVVIFDSQQDAANNGEASGVLIYDSAQFKQRLGGSRYGLVVSDTAEETDSVGSDVMASILALVVGVEKGSASVPKTIASMPPDLADWLLR